MQTLFHLYLNVIYLFDLVSFLLLISCPVYLNLSMYFCCESDADQKQSITQFEGQLPYLTGHTCKHQQ